VKKGLLILLCLPMIGFGQGWEQIINGTEDDVGYSVQQTNDGGYIVVGITALGIPVVGWGGNIWLVKTDVQGDTLWTKTYGGDDADRGYSVQQTTDGGYIITGSTRSFGNGSLPGQSGDDVWLIKTDSQGDTLWTKTYGGSGGDDGKSVEQTNDGGYIITGSTSSFGNGSEDLYLIKTNSQGDTSWTKTYGGVNYDYGHSVQQTNDLGYIVTGMTGGIGGSYVWLIKTDSQGDTSWTKTYGDGNNDYGRSVEQTSDSGYVIAGMTTSTSALSTDVYLIKTDSQGDTSWTCTYGGFGFQEGWSVKQTSDDGYIIAGFNIITNLDDDLYLIKTDGCGNLTSIFNIPTPSSNKKLEKVVDVLGRNIKGKKNQPLFYIYDDGTVEKKIIIE
jgi:hypothetical protein